jgi:hypothetical protein
VFETPPGLSRHEAPKAQLAKYHVAIKLLQDGTVKESIQALQAIRESTDVDKAVDSVLASSSQQSSRTLAELFELLQDESEDVALGAFRSLRKGNLLKLPCDRLVAIYLAVSAHRFTPETGAYCHQPKHLLSFN